MNTKSADIIIHIDENLSTNQILDIESEIGEKSGIQSVCVNDQRRHLMIIDYDPKELSSQTLLHYIKNKGLHAQLVGL